MARSRRKNPITPVTTSGSEADDKKIWHRRYRRAEKQRINKDQEAEALSRSHYSDPWSMSKDGKRYLQKAPAKTFRK